MTEIDDRLRDHYREFLLDEHAIQSILDTDSTSTKSNSQRKPWQGISKGVRWATAAILVISISIGVHDYGSQSERTSRTLNEAAMNHSTRLKLEFKSSDITEINQSMSQLQFAVALPVELSSQLTLQGARYCTINGELAAHLKLVDKLSDKQMSLFMTRSVDDLQSINTTHDRIDGVNVKLWNESGLFYALASRSPI